MARHADLAGGEAARRERAGGAPSGRRAMVVVPLARLDLVAAVAEALGDGHAKPPAERLVTAERSRRVEASTGGVQHGVPFVVRTAHRRKR